MTAFDPHAYGPAVAALLKPARSAPLGPGKPNLAVQPQLAKLTRSELLASQSVVDPAMADCCLAGLWLYHDFLDEAHRICQDIETPSGSCWHAMLHRREGDFSNSGYWFRRVGLHPIFAELRGRVEVLSASAPEAAQLVKPGDWDPFRFVAFCEAIVRGGKDATLACTIQQAEWELLFDFCYQQAIHG